MPNQAQILTPSSFAPAEEIGEYFKKVASKHGVYPFVKFRSRVNRATWEDSEAKWALQVTDTKTGQELEARGDIFINAGGILNDWKWPDIEGLDTFQGRRLHTADWVGVRHRYSLVYNDFIDDMYRTNQFHSVINELG